MMPSILESADHKSLRSFNGVSRKIPQVTDRVRMELRVAQLVKESSLYVVLPSLGSAGIVRQKTLDW